MMKTIASFLLMAALRSAIVTADPETCDGRPGGCAAGRVDSAALLQTVQKTARQNSTRFTAPETDKRCKAEQTTFKYCDGDIKNQANTCFSGEPILENGCEHLPAEPERRDKMKDGYACKHTEQRQFSPCVSPIDVWMMLDDSGSIEDGRKGKDNAANCNIGKGQYPKPELARDFFQKQVAFVEQILNLWKGNPNADTKIDPDSRIMGVWTFSRVVKDLMPMVKIGQETITTDKLLEKLPRQCENTNTGLAMEKLDAEIQKAITDESFKGKSRSYAILVTDGEPVGNKDGTTTSAGQTAAASAAAEKIKAKGVTLVVVAIGSPNKNLMQKWASPGKYIEADFENLGTILESVAETTCFSPCTKNTRKACGRSASWGHRWYVNSLKGGVDEGFAWRGAHVCYCPEGEKGDCTYFCKYDEQCAQFTYSAPHYDFGVCTVPLSKFESCDREIKGIGDVLLSGSLSCFERGTTTMASSSPLGPWVTTKMEDVSVGKYVVAVDDEELIADRVWANLHLADDTTHNLLEIQHEFGSLSLTPDHMLIADGILTAARHVQSGQLLRTSEDMSKKFVDSKVLKVSQKIGRIVNPITHSGFIVATNNRVAVSASTISESVDNVMLDAARFQSLGKVASVMYPAQFQASSTVETTIFLGGAICKTMPALFSLVFCFLADNLVGLVFILSCSSVAKATSVLAAASLITFKGCHRRSSE